MEISEAREGSIVCFRGIGYFGLDNVNDFYRRDVLITRLNAEIAEAYKFVHSKPYTPEKGNGEPIFPEAILEVVRLEDQTSKNLMEIYSRSKKKPIRCKMHNFEFFMVLEEPT